MGVILGRNKGHHHQVGNLAFGSTVLWKLRFLRGLSHNAIK